MEEVISIIAIVQLAANLLVLAAMELPTLVCVEESWGFSMDQHVHFWHTIMV